MLHFFSHLKAAHWAALIGVAVGGAYLLSGPDSAEAPQGAPATLDETVLRPVALPELPAADLIEAERSVPDVSELPFLPGGRQLADAIDSVIGPEVLDVGDEPEVVRIGGDADPEDPSTFAANGPEIRIGGDADVNDPNLWLQPSGAEPVHVGDISYSPEDIIQASYADETPVRRIGDDADTSWFNP